MISIFTITKYLLHKKVPYDLILIILKLYTNVLPHLPWLRLPHLVLDKNFRVSMRQTIYNQIKKEQPDFTDSIINQCLFIYEDKYYKMLRLLQDKYIEIIKELIRNSSSWQANELFLADEWFDLIERIKKVLYNLKSDCKYNYTCSTSYCLLCTYRRKFCNPFNKSNGTLTNKEIYDNWLFKSHINMVDKGPTTGIIIS